MTKIYLGADHRGFAKKNTLKPFLQTAFKNVIIVDNGAHSLVQTDDYNIPARAVAKSVASDPHGFGILFCGSAHGISIQANRHKGIRAVVCNDARAAELGRSHNNANVLCLSADTLSLEEMQKIITVFLTTPFANAERYVRRNQLLDEDF